MIVLPDSEEAGYFEVKSLYMIMKNLLYINLIMHHNDSEIFYG